MKKSVILILCSILSLLCYSQNKKSVFDTRNVYDEKGDYYFEKKDYKKAIVHFNMAYKQDPNNYYSVLRKAEAFSAIGLYDQAAESYRILFNTDLYIPNEYQLQFAIMLLKNRDTKGFEKWLNSYNKTVYEEIHGYLSSSEVRSKMYRDTSILIVENESVLNTPESEIAPSVIGNQVVFASTRKNLMASSANNFYNIFSASYNSSGRLGKLNKYNNNLNSSQSEQAIAFSNSLNKLYITRGTLDNSSLKMFEAGIPAGSTSPVSTNQVNIGGMSNIGHATINTSGTTMYFVSEASGGKGGLDIYTCSMVNGKWSNPKNMGSVINSAKDEMYPFILNDSLLYFSSTGHNSMGGLDLFYINLNDANNTPKNLGNKVNTKYNDYALSFSPEGITGYFCSNRPGGFGKEDIYRLHILDIKVKLEAYKFRRKYPMEDGKINLYLSSGEDYNIASGSDGFNFGFQPQEKYKIVIQHENTLASNIIYNTNLSVAQRQKEFLLPKPLQKTEIPLEPGMRYQFTAGMKPLSNEYKESLNELAKSYQGDGKTSAIDLTALAKELLLNEGEIYTIRFMKDNDLPAESKSKEVTSLFINNQTLDVTNKSFFIVLPLDVEANFNIKTDLGHFKDTYSPKKVGTLKVDTSPVLEEEQVKESEGYPILVNTDTFDDIQKSKIIKAKELSIVPGSMYIFSLSKSFPGTTEKVEIVVPLTKGVQYNLGTEGQSAKDYNQALSQIKTGGNTENEELIDISVLSKELDMGSEKDIIFNLIPAKKFGSQATTARNVLTTLNVDGRKFYVTDMVKLQVNLKLNKLKKVNLQTDLNYIKENFDASTIALKVDKTSFSTDVTEAEKKIITDPVFDVIVVNFDLNEYAIRPDAKSILVNKVIKILQGDSRLYVTIKGYTDGLGNVDHNKKLSSDRAYAVKDFLSKNGIGEKRIRTFSYGESMELKEGVKWEDLSEAELQKHRKVEIVIYLPK